MKKKLWATIIIGGMLLMGVSSIVYASETDLKEIDLLDDSKTSENEYQDDVLEEGTEDSIQKINMYKKMLGEDSAKIQRLRNYRAVKQNVKPKAKFGGVWGYTGDEEIQGYVGGVVGRLGCVGVLKGIWNTTDNEVKGRVVGILKHGFFNGRVINEDGEKTPITGFYKINRENHTFGIKWMTPYESGFVHARYSPIRPVIAEDVNVEEQTLI